MPTENDSKSMGVRNFSIPNLQNITKTVYRFSHLFDRKISRTYLFYFLYPLDSLRPRAHSNFLPLERTNGLACEFGFPGAPKCLFAVRAFLLPCNNTVFFPVGAAKASWSKVRISPPAFKILSLAFSVTCDAHTFE